MLKLSKVVKVNPHIFFITIVLTKKSFRYKNKIKLYLKPFKMLRQKQLFFLGTSNTHFIEWKQQ